jgi:prepilin-type N-terminal cleavage/methylation domain-containing protein/prepilin-type processing-associated H-X9-DG protein
MRHPHRLHRGFSLVEILVVMLIIAALVGLLLPLLARSRAQGRAVQCIANIRQIDLALRAWDDSGLMRLPPADQWTAIVLATARDPRVLICPDDADADISYGYNQAAELSSEWELHTILAMDYRKDLIDLDGVEPDDGPEYNAARHAKRANALFGDSSIQSVIVSELDSASFQLPKPGNKGKALGKGGKGKGGDKGGGKGKG